MGDLFRKSNEGKLIFIEGIPGSGKTTLARRIHGYLVDSGIKNTFYNEGSHNPLDLFWHAFLTEEEFSQVIMEYASMSEELLKHSIFEDEYVLIPYKKLNYQFDEKNLHKYLIEHELCYRNNPLISLDIFKKVFQKRWHRYREACLDNDEITVFESTFLQHNVHDLMRLYAHGSRDIVNYLYSLIMEIVDLKPILIYLTQANVEETLSRVWVERNKTNDTFKYIENSKYGKINNLKGMEGAIKFWRDRKRIEFEAMSILPIKIFVIDNSDYDWDRLFNNIINILKDYFISVKRINK